MKKRPIRVALAGAVLGVALLQTTPSRAGQICHQWEISREKNPRINWETPRICHIGVQEVIERAKDLLPER